MIARENWVGFHEIIGLTVAVALTFGFVGLFVFVAAVAVLEPFIVEPQLIVVVVGVVVAAAVVEPAVQPAVVDRGLAAFVRRWKLPEG